MKTSILKSGKKIDNDIVVVGVGAKPNTEMFKGQLDFLEEKPGGIKVCLLRLAVDVTTEMRTGPYVDSLRAQRLQLKALAFLPHLGLLVSLINLGSTSST